MSIASMLDDIAEDVDLLTRSDEWLVEEYKSISQDLANYAKELYSIKIALAIKRQLQQKNLVPMLYRYGNKLKIKIVNLPDAAKELMGTQNDVLDEISAAAQMSGWTSDGYDVRGSLKIRD